MPSLASLARSAALATTVAIAAASGAAPATAQSADTRMAASNAPVPIAVTPNNSGSEVPREICRAAQTVFTDYVRANISNFSTADREQMLILNQWLSAGCQGTVRLRVGLPEVWALTNHIQTRIGRDRYDFGRVLSLG